MRTRFAPLVAAVAAALVAAQAPAQTSLPRLFVPAVVPVFPSTSAAVFCDVTGIPNAPYLVLVDVDGGPVDLLGVRYQLGLTPAMVTLCAGRLPAFGQASSVVTVPRTAGLVGLPFYLQAIVLNSAAPNGVFEVSNGESTVLLRPSAVIVERFDNAGAEGFTGSYDPAVRDRLQGGAVRRRVQSTIDPQGMAFAQPIATPLNHFGARAQLCYRAQDVGATGEEELLTAVRWRLFGSALGADRFDRLEVLASHSDVVPDYTIDLWSGLPRFPNSGLDPVYANNIKPGETLQSLYAGPYVIRPADLRADGYVDYPLSRPFAYNGTDSLLLDLRVSPSAVPGSGVNGQIVRMMVLSSARPNARVVRYGRAGASVDPNAVTVGRGDNALHEYQLEFVRVKTFTVSPWRPAGVSALDYQTPIVATVEPAGTSIRIEYRGADDNQGNGATGWSASVDGADGKAFLQFRVTFVGDAATGEVPAIDSLVIPVR